MDALLGLAPRKRGPKPDAALAEAQAVKRLQEENARLRRRLEQARTIIAVRKMYDPPRVCKDLLPRSRLVGLPNVSY